MTDATEGQAGDSPLLEIQSPGDAPADDNTQQMEMPLDSEPQQTEDTSEQRVYAGKYNNADELEKAYVELNQMQSKQKQELSNLDLNGIIERAGVDNESVIHNFSSDGRLTDEQYQGFEKIGFGRTLVDEFLQGQLARTQVSANAQLQIQDQARQMAGGEVELNNLLAWAGQNYNEGQVQRFNERLGSPTEYQGAIKEVLYDYRQATATGFTKPLVTGQRMPNTSSGFSTVAELLKSIQQAQSEGHMSEQTKRRIANTPEHILQGIDEKG